MKITIEPTNETDESGLRTISIAVSDNHLNVSDAMELVRDALVAWGFNEASINGYFDPEGKKKL